MKEFLVTSVIVMAAVGMQSCTDDTPKGGTPVETGSEIRFGAILDTEISSRTHYGPETTADGKSVWPIYWNYPDNLDQIFIYSPEGCEGRNQAVYTVHPENDTQTTAAEITKNGDFGVQAGTAEKYNFYGMYPASAVTAKAENGIIKATLPASQSVTFAGTEANPTDIVPTNSQVGDYQYLTTPDMSSCLMTAVNNDVVLEADKAVSLNFTPFSSVIDITIPGPVNNNTITERGDCAVTSVMIIAEGGHIAGDFSYDFTKPTLEEALQFGANARDSIVVSTLGTDANGNMTGIPLANNNTLRLQAFLLPDPNVTKLTVQVFTSDAQIWTKVLDMTNFQPRQIHKVILPKLNFDEAKFDYSRWISQLDPRIYISEISLPGSTSSFSWVLGSTSSDKLQTIRVAEQFKAGIRVFRCHVWLYDMPGADGQSPSFGINIDGQTYVRPLGEVVEQLYNIMEQEHSDEFCVLMISDYKQTIETGSTATDYEGKPVPTSPGNATWNNDNGKTFYERFKVISQKWENEGWVPAHVDANTTIADVKGKVIVKLQLNADGGDDTDLRSNNIGGAYGAADMNSLLTKIQGWSAVNDCSALLNWWTAMNGRNIFYAPMTYGVVGSFTFTNFTNLLNGMNRGTLSNIVPGLGSEAANQLVTNASTTASVWRGSCNLTTQPTNINDAGTFWYIYGAQVKADANYDNAIGLINQAVSAIRNTYNPTTHNKLYMTYLGGSGGGSYTVDDISDNFIERWQSQIGTSWGNRPYGWVLFNTIPQANTQLTGTPATIQSMISKVISQNNDLNFKLQRNLTATPAKAAPSGDTQGTRNGGSVF